MTSPPGLATLVEEYLALRRQLGFELRVEGAHLQRFARYAEVHDPHGPLTIDLAVRWAREPAKAQPRYWARRFAIVRRFAQYCVARDPRTEVPPAGLLGRAGHRPTPHIYSRSELADLLAAAATVDSPRGLRSHTYVTLFGLLAATGLRIGEALRLTVDDVDLTAGILTVARTKFHKARLVPLHETTRAAMQRYVERRAPYTQVGARAFFVTETATPLVYAEVQATFTTLRRTLGWGPPAGRGGPRLHDLRHTFVVERLLHWSAAGVDLDRRVAALATYLGHVKVTDTYWYLTAVPALLAVTAARFEHFARAGDP